MSQLDNHFLSERHNALEQLMQEIRTLLVAQQFPNRLLTIDEACDMLHVGRSTLYKMMSAGELPYIERYGRRIAVSAVLKWIEDHTIPALHQRRSKEHPKV